MFTQQHDPLRLNSRPGPEPIAGELPPPMCLVDEDGPFPVQYSPLMRAMAALIATMFMGAILLMAFTDSPHQIVNVFSAKTAPSSPM